MSDTELQHDKAEFSAAEIYKKHSAFIRRIIHFHVKNESQADDIFQDFFLSLVANPLHDDVRCVESYIYKSVMNCIADTARRATKYKARLNIYAGQTPCMNREDNPADRVIRQEDTKRMFRLIERQLPHNHAFAVMRKYKDNRDIHKTAAIMDLSATSVGRYVSLGLNKMHQLLTVGEGDNI